MDKQRKRNSVCYTLLLLACVPSSKSAPALATNRRVPVEGVRFSFTCTLDAAISGTTLFSKGNVANQGSCLSSGSCGTSVSGYSVSLDSTSRILTLDIASANSTRDSGTWKCTDGDTVSNSITLSQFSAVLDWSSVTFSPQLTSLPTSVTPQNNISITVTTPCAAPAAVVTWRYQQGVSGVPPSSTSSTQGSCPSGQVQTTNTLSLPGNTVSLYNRHVSLTVSVEHDSFDPPTYTNSATSNTIQFPVPVTSVTLTNIISDNEKIGLAADQSLTLTCVTSASFPTSTVTWVTLPPGTTPTVSTETTSGVLVKTTSSVTFNVRSSDQGRSIRCQAENINGQTSPQSNRTTLEVWYGPDTDQVMLTKPANTVVVEDRDLTLTCETLTSVSPGVTFTWDYSDRSDITGGSTGSVTGSAGTTWSQTRTFRPVRNKPDVRCSVRNTKTAVVINKTLSLGDVKYPPPGHPTVQDFTSVMYAGDQKTISCTVTGGNPLANITWSCYNTSNTGSDSSSRETKTSSLTFLVTKHQNSRHCQCRATWMYGGYDETMNQTFTVYYPPANPTTTNPGTLCQGKSTSLTCSSSPDHGNPPATFYWTKNNIAVHTGRSYTLSPVKADNGADIRCVAGNNYTDRAGSSRPQSDARQLSVYYVGVPSITPAATQTRKEGQSLSLTCSVDSNPDNATITWRFNGSLIPGSSVMKADLNRSDDGEYSCTGRVSTGSVCPGGGLQGRSTVKVIVNYAPDITFNPVDITEGQSLTLKCEATGRPDSYTFGSFIQYWEYTSVDTRAGTPAGGVYTWSVGAATYLDTGVYECRVDNNVTDRNDVLVQRKRVSVSVRARPKFTEDSKQIFGAEVGTNTTLSQSFYNSEMNYTSYNWTFGPLDTPVNGLDSVRSRKVSLRKNNKEVQHAGFSVSLDIQNFQEPDIGLYTVTVCNVVGCNSSMVNLTAAGPPLVPLEFLVVNTTLTSVLLRWKSNYPGGDYTQTFLVYYRVKKSGEWKTDKYEDNLGGYVYANITGLQAGTRYEFKVKARNTREQNNEGPFTQIESQETKSPSTSDEDPYVGIAAGAGVGGALLILVLITGIVLLVKRRRQHGEDGEKHLMKSSGSQKKRDEGNEFVSMENDIYQSGIGASKQENEEAVMQENDIYEGDVAAAARTGDVYSQVVKPKKTVEKGEEAVCAKTSKEKKAKKGKDKNLEKQKDAEKKKRNKKGKDDIIPLKPKRTQQNRGDVYENTVPGQFGDGTYANAGYVADDGDSAPIEGQKSGRDEDGLLYVSVDFGNARPSSAIHRAEESTEYAGIAFGQVGALPPPDEEEEKKK